MSTQTVSQKDWPKKENWPQPGWKHTLNEQRFRKGETFGWHEGGYLWTGIVEETAACSVRISDVMPGVMK
jgi:hypothetical protein